MSVIRISFEITSACNLKCRHCLREVSPGRIDIPVEYVDKALIQAKRRYGSQICAITGGEPLLHPEIEKIVESIVSNGYQWFLVTNGTLTDRLANILENDLFRKNLFYVFLSLDGATAQSNDFIRGEGHFEKMLETIPYIISKKVPLGIKTSLNKRNIAEIEQIVNLANKLGVSMMEIINTMPTPELAREKLLPSMVELQNAAQRIEKLRNVYKIPINLCTGFRNPSIYYQCMPLSHFGFHFDYHGNMAFCRMLTNYRGSNPANCGDILGNLGKDDLWDMHEKLIDLASDVNKARLKKIGLGIVSESDHYPCIFCMKYFGKLDWLKDVDPASELLF